MASARFTTWLHRIAMNAALNWLRDQRVERFHERLDGPGAAPWREALLRDQAPAPDQAMHWSARLDEVRDAVAALPSKQRTAVVMHKYREMNYCEIADALGCSVQAVKSLLFRAYENLRARLRSDQRDPPSA